MIKVLMLPEEMKGKVTAKEVREALEKIGEEAEEGYKTYHYTFNCPEEVFEKAKKTAKKKHLSLSSLVANRLKFI